MGDTVHYCVLQAYTIQASSQLIAVFEDRSDVCAVRDMVSKLVLATLGAESAVDLEASLGCVVIYVTFKTGALSFDKLANSLMAEGAELTLIVDPDSHTGFLASERLRGTQSPRD